MLGQGIAGSRARVSLRLRGEAPPNFRVLAVEGDVLEKVLDRGCSKSRGMQAVLQWRSIALAIS